MAIQGPTERGDGEHESRGERAPARAQDAGPAEPRPQDVEVAPGLVIRAEVLSFSFVASQGPGGQNVNKRATKCVLRVRLDELPLTAEQLARLCRVAPSRVTQDGELVVTSDEHRSQERNRTACVGRLSELVRQSLVAPKVRRPTKPSRGAKERRLEGKRQRSDTKRRRRNEGGGGAE